MHRNPLKLLIYLIPLAIFLGLAIFLWQGLHINPHKIPSVLINKKAPQFSIASLEHPQQTFSNQDFHHHVVLLNVWASWCMTCRMEHPILMDIAAQHIVPLYSLDYKDTRKAAETWLREFGNPYTKVGFDEKGIAALDFGVYGTPETFVIDKHGKIRFKQIGAVTEEIWQQQILPLVKKLQKEA